MNNRIFGDFQLRIARIFILELQRVEINDLGRMAILQDFSVNLDGKVG